MLLTLSAQKLTKLRVAGSFPKFAVKQFIFKKTTHKYI